ncbi:MAG: WecB/TagA/CpsF family glycosyltransferase [Candidatus Acetothermia bacterium]
MTSMTPLSVFWLSLVVVLSTVLLFRDFSRGLITLGVAGVPLILLVVVGFNWAIIGLAAGLGLLSVSNLPGYKSAIPFGSLKGLALVSAGLVAYWAGFRIQFASLAFQSDYLYFSWLSLPLTLGWLWVITRSVEYVYGELGRRSWSLFLTTVFTVTFAFLVLVAVQADQGLQLGLNLGLVLLALCLGLVFVKGDGGVRPVLARQLGFMLAALAISGVVKSLTAFVLIAPVASLVVPVSSKSWALVRGTFVQSEQRDLLSWISEYTGSRQLSVVAMYCGLSYLGLGSAWYIWDPSPIPFTILASSGFLLPFMIWLTRGVVEFLQGYSKSIFSTPRSVSIFGVRFCRTDLTETTDRLLDLISGPGTKYVATPDVTAVMKAKSNMLLRRAFSSADIVTPDGTGLVWASQVMDADLPERVAGIDVLADLFDSAGGLEVFLLGSRREVVKEAGAHIVSSYPGVEVVGTHHGYFSKGEEDQLVQEINQVSPDVVLVGMGVPRQERWIFDNMEDLDTGLLMGVGGSFDVLSGRLPRAPQLLRKLGLEWLYRIWLEPSRLWKARLIPLFMSKVAREKLLTTLKDQVL